MSDATWSHALGAGLRLSTYEQIWWSESSGSVTHLSFTCAFGRGSNSDAIVSTAPTGPAAKPSTMPQPSTRPSARYFQPIAGQSAADVSAQHALSRSLASASERE